MAGFKDIFSKIENAINSSKVQALNKAANSTKTAYSKAVSEELGLPSARIKKRAKVNKASLTNLKVELSIGTKVKFAAQDFKPSETKVSTSKGARYAANYKIKDSRKSLPKGAFLTTTNNSSTTKKLVLERVGDSKYPTQTVLVDVFIPVVEAIKPDLEKKMREDFEKYLLSQIEYNLSK